MDYSNVELTKKEFGMVSAVVVVGFLVVGYLFYNTLRLVVLSPLVLFLGRKTLARWNARRVQGQLRLAFRDFLHCIAGSFAAGRHIYEAMVEAQEELRLIHGDEEPMMKELAEMLRKIRVEGQRDMVVLQDFARRSHLEDVQDFANVFQACRETGGDLSSAMNRTARMIGEKITIENEIKTMVVQKKTEGKVITLMPLGVILFLRMLSPEYIAVLYTTMVGRVVMTLAIAGIGGAYYMIERITDIDV